MAASKMENTEDAKFIYSVQYERVYDGKQSIMLYFSNYLKMTRYALKIAWHFASDWPIEFYKCDRVIMKIFSTLSKNEQYIINCLLLLRYDQNYNTGILLTMDEVPEERINAAVPEELLEFNVENMWNIIIFLNTIAHKNNYGFITKKSSKSVLISDNYNNNNFGTLDDVHDMLDGI